MKISTPTQLREYYQQTEIAEEYIAKRFSEPLNIVEHQRQVKLINKIIAERGIKNILEFAPGPARLTIDLEATDGTSIDFSEKMISIAKQRMGVVGKKWNFIKGDILTIKLKEKYDLLFCIRFILHFQQEEREIIYQQARSALCKGGYLVFEALNKKKVERIRNILGRKNYHIYDKLYTRQELEKEVERNGFKVLQTYPILNNFWCQAILSRPCKMLGMKSASVKIINLLEKIPSSQPYEWIVLCQKK
ncbi:MAG: class I SAM-dependent methyltransferase [Nanoarchaeota archaeon]